jgi:hypothetical protein
LAGGNRSGSKGGGNDKAKALGKKKRGIKKSEEEWPGGTRKTGSPACIKGNFFGASHPRGDENTKRQVRR